MLPTRIILIGYRGTGKTSVGQRLAASLGYDCLDADVELERIAGASIKQIFQREGEDGFRQREADVVRELCSRERVVLSLGGGAILREGNRRQMAREGSLVIWLQAAAETLYDRIAADATTTSRRPNLTADGGLEEVIALLAQREPCYRAAADWELDTEGQTIDEVASSILARLAQ